MFDTMTCTKIVGGFCGTFLVFLLGNFAAHEIYRTSSHAQDGVQGYLIASADGEAPAPQTATPGFDDIYAGADADAGARVFGKCKACHKVDGGKATGPHLDGVVGRAVGSVAGYNYSGALKAKFATWTPENLQTFLANPKQAAPGTKMTFAGLKEIQDRADVIAYLNSLGK